MASDGYPGADWKHVMRGDCAERLTVVAYEPDDGHPGAVTLDVDENARRTANVLLATRERREEFARAFMEACRRADGEPPALDRAAMPGQSATGADQ